MPLCPVCSRIYGDGFDHCSEDGTQLIADSAPASIEPGTQIETGLQTRNRIGAGPTGEIYAADYQGRLVTVKLLSEDLSRNQVFCKHLNRLLSHLAKVHHPGVASIIPMSGDSYNGRPLIVRELVSGRSLSEYVRRMGPLQEQAALDICLKAASALTEAHRAGALHLNIKPSNLFLTDEGDIKVVDFGIGQQLEINKFVIHGDPRYLAPEQFEGKLVSFRSDIYGLGALLFFLLTGRPPFEGNNAKIYQTVTTQRPTAPSSVVPNLSGFTKLDQIVLRALEKVPAKRYLSVQHFARMMDGVLQDYSSPSASFKLGAPPRGSKTLPMGQETLPHDEIATQKIRDTIPQPSPGSGYNDTVRMPSPGYDTDSEDYRTVRDHAPPMAFHQSEVAQSDTIRMAVPPVPVGLGDTQPMAFKPIEVRGDDPAMPSVEVDVASDFYDKDTIEIVTEPLPPRRKKKKKRKKREPIVAVRGEAPLQLGPVESATEGTLPSKAVLLDNQFLDEARGPERNLATLEIRLQPGQDMLDEKVSKTGKSKPRIGRFLLIILALLFLFFFAAVGAAMLSRWMSSSFIPPEIPAQSATSE